MKKYATRTLNAVAHAYLALPLAYVIILAVFFDIPAVSLPGLVFSPLYIFTVLWASVAGYGLLQMRRWGWYVFLIANGFIVYSNLSWSFELGESHHKWVAVLFMLVVQVFLTHRVAQEVRVPYFLPKIRWWESRPPFIPAKIMREAGNDSSGKILDLSTKGCFIKTRENFEFEEAVRVTFSVFGHQLVCRGLAVWCTEGKVTHPRGIGVRFVQVGKKTRRLLRVAAIRLKRNDTVALESAMKSERLENES